MKNMTTWIAVAGIVLCVVIVFQVSQHLTKVSQNLDQERYQRMEAEEKLLKTEAQLKSLQRDAAQAESKLQSIEAVLEQGKTENADLKVQLEAINKTKSDLEQRIQEIGTPALPTPPAAAP